MRVDGNDVLAVLVAVREARKRCLEQGRAVLVESMTYRYLTLGRTQCYWSYYSDTRRVGHHSTSDDSFAYRARQEVEDRKRLDNPLSRLRLFLESRGWWNAEEEQALKTKQKREVLEAFKRGEVMKRWELKELFEDVYGGEEPWNLVSHAGSP